VFTSDAPSLLSRGDVFIQEIGCDGYRTPGRPSSVRLCRWFLQTHTFPSAILLDELNAGFLKRPSDCNVVCRRRRAAAGTARSRPRSPERVATADATADRPVKLKALGDVGVPCVRIRMLVDGDVQKSDAPSMKKDPAAQRRDPYRRGRALQRPPTVGERCHLL
jgi:hypothetical protein